MPERDCAACTDVQKAMWGCDGNAQIPVDIMGEQQTTCPRRPVLDNPRAFSYWLGLYRNYRLGVLPESGGLLDQSEYALVLFNRLDAVYAQIQEYKADPKNRKK